MRQVYIHVYSGFAMVRRAASGDAKPKTYAQRLDDLANRMALALEELMGWAKTHDEFRESDHPRASDGRFGMKAGEHGHAEVTTPKPTSSQAKGAFNQVRELLSSGHSFTREELMAVTGLTPKKLGDYLAMLKNPKYAGPAGALNIVKNADGTFSVMKASGGVTPPAPPPVAPPAPAPAPKPPEPPATPPAVEPATAPAAAPGSYEEAMTRYEELRKHAYGFGAAAKTESDHRKAAQVYGMTAEAARHADMLAGNKPDSVLSIRAAEYERAQARHLAKVRELHAVATARAARPADTEEKVKKIEARFLKKDAKEIDALMRLRFGLHVSAGDTHYMVRGAKPVDLNGKGTATVGQRKMLGHVYEALDGLEKQGFDVKAALARDKPVEYAPASLSRCNGLAWQGPLSGKARFTVSGSKRLNDNAAQFQQSQARQIRGQHRWTVSADALGPEAARATIVHELAHAAGMRPGVNSPARLSAILTEHMKTEPLDPLDKFEYGRVQRQRSAWIKKNISEYAAANIHETDAELAAMVTAPSYVRGTLPKVFEDHVDWLFAKRSAA